MPPVGGDREEVATLWPQDMYRDELDIGEEQVLALPQETVNVFDWDDTLLASSYLASKGYRLDAPLELTEDVAEQLSQLEQAVIALLQTAIKSAPTCIITNAETGWVQLSAAKFIPGVVPLLAQVTIISARSSYEDLYPENPQAWKLEAFMNQLKQRWPSGLLGGSGVKDQAPAPVLKNVLSFGDSHVEREAVHVAARRFSMAQTKSVKFVERPTLEQLRRQVELVASCFDFIASHRGDLDLMLTISMLSEQH